MTTNPLTPPSPPPRGGFDRGQIFNGFFFKASLMWLPGGCYVVAKMLQCGCYVVAMCFHLVAIGCTWLLLIVIGCTELHLVANGCT